MIDEGVLVTFYGDGYGDIKKAGLACSVPQGYVTNNTYCNDANANINPVKAELCGNGIDDNGKGLINKNCGNVAAISINDVTVYESDGVAVLTVSSDRVTTTAIKIHYDTENGTAVGERMKSGLTLRRPKVPLTLLPKSERHRSGLPSRKMPLYRMGNTSMSTYR